MKKILLAVLLSLGVATVLLGQPPVVQPDPPAAIVDEKLYTPESSMLFAVADLKTVPPELQQNMRYFSLYNIPANKRDDYAKMLSFVCNSLSTRKKIYIPVFVGASDKTVVRINIKDYDWPVDAWEKLALEGSGVRPFPEPYFHTLLVKEAEIKFRIEKRKQLVKKTVTKEVLKDVQVGTIANTGQPYYEKRKVQEQVVEEVEEEVEVKIPIEQKNLKESLASAPWLNADIMKDFIKMTQSQAPIVRADWFICYATLPPAYYNFLKLGDKLQDFEKFAFADPKKAEEARGQDRAVIIQSGVTRNNRRARRSPTFTGGYYWETFDTLNSIRGNKSLTNLLDDKFDAGEFICSLPNGLQAYYLSNGKFERQDEAPINIAKDMNAVDGVVRNGRSCMICHAEGIKPIDDEVRALNRWNPNHDGVRLLVTKEKDAYKIDDLFSSDLDKQVTKDMQLFADAVGLTNGLKPAANAKIYAEVYDRYIEHLMTKEDVARDCALTLPQLDALLKLSNDPVMLGLLRRPIRAVRRDQFEESFQSFMLLVVASKLQPGEVPRVVLPEKAPGK